MSLVCTPIGDPDILQHIVVGKSIWQDHAVRGLHRWSWPLYGVKEVTESWLYCFIIYPIWHSFGLWGLYAWRWITTLLAFAILVATARRIGASPMVAVPLAVWCILIYRGRADVRPETLPAVLMAIEFFILESGRHGNSRYTFLLVPLLYVWTQAHISFIIGYYIVIAFLADDLVRATGSRVRTALPLLQVAMISLAVSLLGPFGWGTLALPFKYLLFQRGEAITKSIGELAPINWSIHQNDGLFVLMVLSVGIALWRWRRTGFDAAEFAILGAALTLSLNSQRFLGFFAEVSALYVARDLTQCAFPSRHHELSSLPRNVAAITMCVLVALPTWTSPTERRAVEWDLARYPIGAADFIAAHDIRGRSYDNFWLSGYLLHRFWPDRDRLPFMDIHQFGSREDRDLQTYAEYDARAWEYLEGKYHFDYVVIAPDLRMVPTLATFLERDSTWAMVYYDDAGVLYVRRRSFPAVAQRYGYDRLSGSDYAMKRILAASATDTLLRRQLWQDGLRQLASAPGSVRARSLLGILDAMNGEFAGATRYFHEAIAIDPYAVRVREKLGVLALAGGRYAEARRYFRDERRILGWPMGYDFRMGQVSAAEGNLAAARGSYLKELSKDPGNAEAKDSLAALDRRVAPR